MGATVLAYFARPWSCAAALSGFTPEDPVPYARFDYHGVGVLSGLVAALIFAAPLFWLAREVFLRGASAFRIFGKGPDLRTTILSVVIALAIGAPMQSQVAYLIGLPIVVSAPVVVSSLIWLLLVEVGRTAALQARPLNARAMRVAVVLALLVAVPKLALLAYFAVHH